VRGTLGGFLSHAQLSGGATPPPDNLGMKEQNQIYTMKAKRTFSAHSHASVTCTISLSTYMHVKGPNKPPKDQSI